MNTAELKTLKPNTRVFNRIEETVLTIVNTVGFTNKGNTYIPCADDKNNIDDYNIDHLIIFSGKRENTNKYLDRLRQEYAEYQKANKIFHGVEQIKHKIRYNAMRLFCLDCELVSFNDIEVMENEVNSSF